MSDEGLDKLFQKGLSERNVAFNMESWRKMEQMLPAEAKPAGFKFGKVAAVIGVLLVTSASILIWDLANNSQTDIPSVSKGNILSNNTEISTTSNLNLDKGQINESEVDAVKKERKSAKINSNTANLTASTGEEKGLLNHDKSAPDHQISIKNPTASNNIEAIKRRKRNNARDTDINKVKTVESNYAVNTGSSNAFFKKNDGFNSLTISKEEALGFDELADESNVFVQIEGLDELQTFSTMEEEDHTMFAEIGNSKLPKLKRNEIGFIGGLNVSRELVESTSKGVAGCEFLGVTYKRYLNGGLSLTADLLYAPRNEVNSVKNYAKKVYGFGSVVEETKVSSERLIYMEMPIMLNYNLGNHNFMAGPSVSYLVTGKHQVSTTYTSQTESHTEGNTQWGHTDGYKRFDFALVGGYEYSIKPKLNVGLRLNYGLTDVTNNDYFGTDSFDNNVQLRVYLKYSPFNF
ncbi:MAG: porin family protein [Salibacteraceae bacterium]